MKCFVSLITHLMSRIIGCSWGPFHIEAGAVNHGCEGTMGLLTVRSLCIFGRK